ncbi:alanine dehydrogenase [Desulfohalobium retbaense]|uniref:Alanine dehydrogenase n=1 Tax=Desulfohalobium retbaense (strain ATCC 49708 / DSM 5692 / JCM 16813 / HR100) TaxID=485915 RepID=C8X2X4_DESRD|nr:alanine dehydrogenase [Desulfohalobium retbaense]ACV68771.1 alanine dehydrogenase [Desulfohalobium retbaense DSM 5692]
MRIGVLKEIKVEENRVCMTPAGVEVMKANGHTVLVEKNAGVGSGFSDDDYITAGAEIIDTPKEIFDQCDMVMHVKEPQPSEYELIRENQIVFTYFHFAADEELTRALMKTNSIAIAYETVVGTHNDLPLLTPMSEVAGRMATQEAAKFCERSMGGLGILFGGVTGVAPAKVLVIGGGIVGTNAALMAAGLGADVTILDLDLDRLRYLSEIMPANCRPLKSSPALLRELAQDADAVIGAVLVTGAKAPKLITREMLKSMKKGSVLVDVAIDQGGCFETSRPTTHTDPVFEVEGVIHYCVANMPGAVPVTSTMALTNATLPYAVHLANKGWRQACKDVFGLKEGVNMVNGKITYKGVADAFGLDYTPIDEVL